MKILIDNGHGENTAGKQSPDGKLREYAYAREIAKHVESGLKARGYDAIRIVTEETDVPLAERTRRVNEVCGRYGTANVLLVSIHCNAAGNGAVWESATGWEAYTSPGQTNSDVLAELLYNEAYKNFHEKKIRTDKSDGDNDKEDRFYILMKTKCPAVLTENFFMDSREDVEYLNSDEGKQAIIKTHVDAIIRYVQKYDKAD